MVRSTVGVASSYTSLTSSYDDRLVPLLYTVLVVCGIQAGRAILHDIMTHDVRAGWLRTNPTTLHYAPRTPHTSLGARPGGSALLLQNCQQAVATS